ncbi:hypothetical protein [Chitinivorax sp. B]|uniref:hypothetical protein n=1 Tax=Chitinivorax sp. B TaxID=2502235 RepID=UPI0010F8E9F6|nr:hypothetical protein [Chitinivorax sp. B]
MAISECNACSLVIAVTLGRRMVGMLIVAYPTNRSYRGEKLCCDNDGGVVVLEKMTARQLNALALIGIGVLLLSVARFSGGYVVVVTSAGGLSCLALGIYRYCSPKPNK